MPLGTGTHCQLPTRPPTPVPGAQNAEEGVAVQIQLCPQ